MFRTAWADVMDNSKRSVVKGSKSKAPLLDPLGIQIPWPINICIAGLTNSGKTYLLRALVDRHQEHGTWKKIIAFAGSGRLNGDYGWVDENSLLSPDESGMAKLEKILMYVEKVTEAGFKFPILIIFDDFIGTLSMKGSTGKMMEKLISSGRHLNVSVIFLTQRLTKHLSPTIRENCNMWFIMNLNKDSICDVVFEKQTQYDDKNVFWDVCRDHRSKVSYGPIVIRNAAPGQQSVLLCSEV